MISAFQRSGFQDNAFQIGVALGAGAVWYPHLWRAERLRLEREKREAEEAKAREEAEALVAAVVPELVVAQSAPVITDLTALVAVAPIEAAAPTVMAKPEADDGLQKFLALMISIAQEEDTCT